MTIRTEQLGAWTLHFSDEEVMLKAEHVQQKTHFLNKEWLPWVRQDYAVRYNPQSLSFTKWGVPSFLI